MDPGLPGTVAFHDDQFWPTAPRGERTGIERVATDAGPRHLTVACAVAGVLSVAASIGNWLTAGIPDPLRAGPFGLLVGALAPTPFLLSLRPRSRTA